MSSGKCLRFRTSKILNLNFSDNCAIFNEISKEDQRSCFSTLMSFLRGWQKSKFDIDFDGFFLVPSYGLRRNISTRKKRKSSIKAIIEQRNPIQQELNEGLRSAAAPRKSKFFCSLVP